MRHFRNTAAIFFILMGIGSNAFGAMAPTVKNDFNLDGKADILWRDNDFKTWIWYIDQDGKAGYQWVNKKEYWQVKAIDDFNGDGYADILWINDKDKYTIWLMDDTGKTGYIWIGDHTEWSVKGSGDINGDGYADILWQKDDDSYVVKLMDTTGETGEVVIGGKSGWSVEGMADVSGDGKADILWERDDGQYAVKLMDETGEIGTAWIGDHTGWSVEGMGDVNGDDKSDILWRKDNDKHTVKLMDETGEIGTVWVGGNVNWQVDDVNDFNGDGYADILWVKDNGKRVIWWMDGTGKTGSTFIGGGGWDWSVMPGFVGHPPGGKNRFIVSPISGTSSQVSFAIALEHKPDSNVTINYSSADETVAKPTTNTMTFTPENWYRSQVVTVDIFNPSSSTEILFEPTVSSDSNYNNKSLEQVSIVSHQLLLFEPVDKIVYSEFNMSVPISIAYVGDNEANITVTLDTAPTGMTLDINNGRLLWNPPVPAEGQNSTVVVAVSDSIITNSITFELHVAQPTLLSTSIVNDKLVITDSNSSLNGLSIQALDGAVLADYRLYKLSTNDTPAFTQGESVVGETLLVKGNIGKNVQVLLPLQERVETNELLSFHTKSYFGTGNWRRVDYDYDFVGTMSDPVYVLNTDSLFGVMAFTKILQSQQTKVSSSDEKSLKIYAPLNKQINSTIHCVPQTWSFLNLTDYDNQICTFDDNPNFTLQIFNYPDADISNNTPIEEVADWIIKAQNKLIELGMPYRNYSALSFEKIDEYGNTNIKDSSPDGPFFVNYPTIMQYMLSKIKLYLSYRDSQITIYHEYFHQAQAAIQNNTLDLPKALWLIESSAFWFSDYVDGNSGYAYTTILSSFSSDRRIFRDVIMYSSSIASTSGQGFSQGGVMRKAAYAELYDRSLFLEMIENYCPNFTNYIPYLFQKDINDPTSLQHLNNVVYSSNCNFGTSPTGQGNESRIETAILYYQYISDIKHLDNLINPNIPVGRLGFLYARPWDFKISDFTGLSLGQYYVNRYFSGSSIDSKARTAHIPTLNSALPRCQERYIRIKSEKTILVSLASNDTSFPDTPNTMLGDMKQINFGMLGKTDFTYFYDQNTGKQIYPEMYLTITDVVDDTTNLTPQNVEVGIGLRRTNLLSHIDGKDMCAEYVPQITETTVAVKGEIPTQYRDSNEPLQYIDRIKMTCLESGEVFNAVVDSDGKWSTTINITFSGNESRFSIEGYNASDNQRIIAYQGLTIVR